MTVVRTGAAVDAVTVTDADPDTVPTFAVMVAAPVATAVTTPVEATVATGAAELDQVNVCPVIVLPF